MYQTATQFADTMPDARILLSDEPEMESSLHYFQLMLLVACLNWHWQDRSDYFIGANLTIYFSRQQLKKRDFRGPGFFLVKDVTNQPRNSWVVWEEDGRYPNLIIELLSDSTSKTDRTLKKELYQNRFRTPEYFWFSPNTQEFMGYRLIGNDYQEIPLTPSGKRWSEELQLFLGVENKKLCYFTPEEELILSPDQLALREQQRVIEERQRANHEQQRADQEQQRADQEQQRADRLAAYLRSLNIDPDTIP
jgi:Uma2 family endonuclease